MVATGSRFESTAPRLGRMVQRPRLTATLRQRFDVRLTLLTGPGGAGKTTTLTLAMEDNRLDPFGVDVWYAATEHDRDPGYLATGLARALGVPSANTVDRTVTSVLETVWAMAPRDVAIIVDDVHLIDSPVAVATLANLLNDLPSNGHLLLAGRAQPELAAARLRAHGQVLDVAADDLAFDDDELAELIKSRLDANTSRELSTEDWPRLPALADLRISAGPGADADFLWEEILNGLGEGRRRVLRRASVLQTIDDTLIDALSGGSMTARALVEGLPLVEPASHEAFRLHGLLRSALRGRTGADEIRDAARVAGSVELERGNLRAAAELFADAGEVDALVEAARRYAVLPAMRRTFQDQLVLRSLVESARPGSVLADLLRAESQFGELSTTTDVGRLGADLVSVADRARGSGEADLEAVALYRAMVWISLDGDVPAAMVDRLGELAGAVPFAAQALRYVQSEQAMYAGDPEASFAYLSPAGVDAEYPDLELVDRMGQLCNLGRPEEVGVGLTTADLAGMPDGAELYVGFALWTRGQLTPEVALPIALSMTAQTLARRVVHPIVAILGVTSFMALAQGDSETAIRHVRQARDEAQYGCSTRIRAFISMAAAATALETEGEAAAAEVLGDMLGVIPMGNWPIPSYLLGLPMIYLLRPETRPTLDRCRFGPALTTARNAGVALAELRETGSTAAAASLPWDREACLRAHVLPAHLCELAVAASLAGVTRAEELLVGLPALRASLARVATVSTPSVAAAAAARLDALPRRPLHRVTIAALGPLRVFRDGEPVTDPDWARRSRVRELLGLLVEERRVSRAKVAALGWPDLEPDKAMGNLRVTLSYLQRVLEPDRPANAEPQVIRSMGDQLVLDEDVLVDVDRFDRAMARALDHDRAGAPGAALELYRRALAAYDGDYLAGLDVEWAGPTRTRLQLLALSAMLRVGELELAAGEPDRAVGWAMRAASLSPGNERAGRLHAGCLQAVGDRLGAASELRALVARLAAEGLEAEPETMRLLQRLVGTRPAI